MLTLRRKEWKSDGIFSELCAGDEVLFQTLEHSYDCKPKIPNGTYTCVRGMHALSSGPPFVTFEITGVDGHKGLLFHCGNANRDSEGCVLVGMERSGDMILKSREAFANFMHMLEGVKSFQLTVI